MGKGSIDDARILHDLLKLTNRLLVSFSTHLADRYAISVNEFRVLMMIGNRGITASHEIVEDTGVHAMTVSRAVASLELSGRVTAIRDPENRRRKALRLTAEGERLYAIMLGQTMKVSQYMVSDLSTADISAFGRMLSVLIGTLEAHDEEGRSLFLERTRPDDPA